MDDIHDSLLCSQYFIDKVLLTGDNGVGKTSIFNRFLTGMFERDVYQHRVAEHKKIWEIDGKQVSVCMYICMCGFSMIKMTTFSYSYSMTVFQNL